jgi:hypothetical protein
MSMVTYGTVARETRFLIWLTIAVIAPFGVILYLYPSSAGDNWAWEIAQPRTAMLVGAIYFATSLYYVLLSRQREWLLLQAACARCLRQLLLLVAAMFIGRASYRHDLMVVTYYSRSWRSNP